MYAYPSPVVNEGDTITVRDETEAIVLSVMRERGFEALLEYMAVEFEGYGEGATREDIAIMLRAVARLRSGFGPIIDAALNLSTPAAKEAA